MKHGLGGGQLRDRRHDAERVGSEHDEIAWMAGTPGLRRVWDEVERVGSSRILRFGSIVEVTNSGQRIEDDIFKNRPEALCCRINRWLRFGTKLDGLRVTAPFEVEDALWPPSVLVVANERPQRIG